MNSNSADDCLAAEVCAKLAHELADLEEKIGRLLYALKWNDRIPAPQKRMLWAQEKAMFLYRDILRDRMTDIMTNLGERD